MSYLEAEHINKAFGDKRLLDDISMTISRGDKIALIARNGEGKSTLLRILAGVEKPDGENAVINRDKGVKVSYLAQDPELPPKSNVLEAIFHVDEPSIQAIKAYEQALQTNDPESIRKTAQTMDDLKAWNKEAKIKEILYLLNLRDFSQLIHQLSGGQKKRLALAKAIISNPDFLILDEPTNHLDIEMIEWLEKYLQNPSLTLLIVTHDRYFLNRVCHQIWELDKAQIRVFKGNYSDYLDKKSAIIENDRSAHGKLLNLYKKELDWIRRQPKARTSKSKSRIDQFEHINEQVTSHRSPDSLTLELGGRRLGKKILELHNVSKSYDSVMLLNNFTYKFQKGEKLGIVGPNGTGKTTLAELIMGLVKPDKGRIISGETIRSGYYSQSGMDFSPGETLIDAIRKVAEYIELDNGQKITAEQLLDRFLFPRYQHRVKISKLSGGEQRRVYLLQVLMKLPNFLILDEPTNDLDIPTLNILEDYLIHFEGCVIAISHDRYFLDKIADHLFIFHGKGEIMDYNGTYSSYRKQVQEESKPDDEGPTGKASDKIINEKRLRKLSYLEKKEMEQTEKDLEALETEKSQIEKHFEKGLLKKEEIQSLSVKLGELIKQIREKEDRWLELSQYL